MHVFCMHVQARENFVHLELGFRCGFHPVQDFEHRAVILNDSSENVRLQYMYHINICNAAENYIVGT